MYHPYFYSLSLSLSRFNDVSPSVRIECIRYSKYFLVYHPHLAGEVARHLHERFHDREEKVRMETVKVVSEAAADDAGAVPQGVSVRMGAASATLVTPLYLFVTPPPPPPSLSLSLSL